MRIGQDSEDLAIVIIGKFRNLLFLKEITNWQTLCLVNLIKANKDIKCNCYLIYSGWLLVVLQFF